MKAVVSLFYEDAFHQQLQTIETIELITLSYFVLFHHYLKVQNDV